MKSGAITSKRADVFARAADRWPQCAPDLKDLAQIEEALGRMEQGLSAALSQNTQPEALAEFCREMGDLFTPPSPASRPQNPFPKRNSRPREVRVGNAPKTKPNPLNESCKH